MQGKAFIDYKVGKAWESNGDFQLARQHYDRTLQSLDLRNPANVEFAAELNMRRGTRSRLNYAELLRLVLLCGEGLRQLDPGL